MYVISEIRKHRTEEKMKFSQIIPLITIEGSKDIIEGIKITEIDIKNAVRVENIKYYESILDHILIHVS